MIHIRKALPGDAGEIWNIIHRVIQDGDTYAFDPSSSKDEMLAYWCAADKHTYVAVINEEIKGTFIMKDNQPGLGSHVANAGHMTSPDAFGKGIGKAMALFSLEEAKNLGYRAMQFNLVIKTNERAVELWKKLGFAIIGEIAEAFNHKSLGLTNAYIMYRKL